MRATLDLASNSARQCILVALLALMAIAAVTSVTALPVEATHQMRLQRQRVVNGIEHAAKPDVPACVVGQDDYYCSKGSATAEANGKQFCCGGNSDRAPNIAMNNNAVKATCPAGTKCQARTSEFTACQVGINDANCGKSPSPKFCCPSGANIKFQWTLVDGQQLVTCAAPSNCATRKKDGALATPAAAATVTVPPPAKSTAPVSTLSKTAAAGGALSKAVATMTAAVTYYDDSACTVMTGSQYQFTATSGQCYATSTSQCSSAARVLLASLQRTP